MIKFVGLLLLAPFILLMLGGILGSWKTLLKTGAVVGKILAVALACAIALLCFHMIF